MSNALMGQIFGVLQEELRKQLISEYSQIYDNYIYGNYLSTEVNGGRFCEIVYSILDGYFKEKYPESAEKPKNMVDACRQFELQPNTGNVPHSFRITIPRLLPALYDIRNNRNAGHVGSGIDPNFMDSTFVIRTASWIMAELIRVFHPVDAECAQGLVDELSMSGSIPSIWAVGDKHRVLMHGLKIEQQVLIILSRVRSRTDQELYGDVEYSSLSLFKKRILVSGHTKRIWEYDGNKVTISPIGQRLAEEILKRYGG